MLVDETKRAAAIRSLHSGSRFFWCFIAITAALLVLLFAALLDGGDETFIVSLAVVIVGLVAVIAWVGAGLNQLSRALRDGERGDAHEADQHPHGPAA